MSVTIGMAGVWLLFAQDPAGSAAAPAPASWVERVGMSAGFLQEKRVWVEDHGRVEDARVRLRNLGINASRCAALDNKSFEVASSNILTLCDVINHPPGGEQTLLVWSQGRLWASGAILISICVGVFAGVHLRRQLMSVREKEYWRRPPPG